MLVVQLVDTIKKKQELGFTIERLSSESGVGTRIINIILAGADVRYSSIELLLRSLNLSMTVEKH